MQYFGNNCKSPNALFIKVTLIHFDEMTTSWKSIIKHNTQLKINDDTQLSTQEYNEHSEKCLFFPNLVRPILSKLYFFESIKKLRYIINVTIDSQSNSSLNYVDIYDENNFVTCDDNNIKTWIKNQDKYSINKKINNAHNGTINL